MKSLPLFQGIFGEKITYADMLVGYPKYVIVNIYVKNGIFRPIYRTKNRFRQDSKYPCFNFKRELIDKVYEAEVTYEGETLPYIAVLNIDEKAIELMPDFEEGLESLSEANKNYIMPFMPQIQQAKELSALKEGMKIGEI